MIALLHLSSACFMLYYLCLRLWSPVSESICQPKISGFFTNLYAQNIKKMNLMCINKVQFVGLLKVLLDH